jgi:hypothetical protein
MTNNKLRYSPRKIIDEKGELYELPDIPIKAVNIGKPGYNRRSVEKLTKVKKSSAKRRPFGKRR